MGLDLICPMTPVRLGCCTGQEEEALRVSKARGSRKAGGRELYACVWRMAWKYLRVPHMIRQVQGVTLMEVPADGAVAVEL